MQEMADKLIATAKARDTRRATNPAGYRGDDFSRTLGPLLRKAVRVRAEVDMTLEVFYRYPTGATYRHLGKINVRTGEGSIDLPEDPRRWIVETVWPKEKNVLSPIESDDALRLWLFPDE